jgi:hypothetical protein
MTGARPRDYSLPCRGLPAGRSFCRIPVGTVSRRGRLGDPVRGAVRLSRYCVAAAASPRTRASDSSTCGDGLR